jgi:NitT/TauT family transport system permease protein
MRILLGWAWTYLIVAEVVGTMSGITFFINQQARYRNFDNVYAAIFMIGIIGLTSDMLLAGLGKVLFPWKRRSASGRKSLIAWMREPGPAWRKEPPNPRAAAVLAAKT